MSPVGCVIYKVKSVETIEDCEKLLVFGLTRIEFTGVYGGSPGCKYWRRPNISS